jgi:hydroxymethylglutaryl-CoA reductase (NADPH)
LINRSFEKGQTMAGGNSRKADHTGKLGRETTFDKVALDAARRWKRLDLDKARAELFHQRARDNAATYRRNIESYIGTVDIPVGLAGPLRINGRNGTVIYQVPLATTEAALVASYQRGSRLITAAGGCDVRVLDQGVSRAPMFAFEGLVDAERFARFITDNSGELHAVVAKITSHGRLIGVRPVVEGNHVYVDLRFRTGDASGQNMVTFAADAVCKAILEQAPVKPEHWFLEANFSGDKKASSKTLGDVRGKRVAADLYIPRELVRQRLHTTPERIVDYWYAGALGGVMSGTTGIQGHFANGLAALYLACGQDVACVAESATGTTRFERTAENDLYACVTLPNIMVGTVGGGTGLPSAKACLDILGLAGAGKSIALAEVCAGIVLAGELSIVGALCSGDFATAHLSLSRGESMNKNG